jgi:hypothetical protein
MRPGSKGTSWASLGRSLLPILNPFTLNIHSTAGQVSFRRSFPDNLFGKHPDAEFEGADARLDGTKRFMDGPNAIQDGMDAKSRAIYARGYHPSPTPGASTEVANQFGSGEVEAGSLGSSQSEGGSLFAWLRTHFRTHSTPHLDASGCAKR